MNISNCNKSHHAWICKSTKGALNEIITYKNINNLELEKIKNGDESLCSTKNIECKNCGTLFFNNTHKTDNDTITKQLKHIKLIK